MVMARAIRRGDKDIFSSCNARHPQNKRPGISLKYKTVNDLKNQTAEVTGGGQGLGRAFAQALAAAGANVTVIARSQNELDETVAAIGPQARAFRGDVTDAWRHGRGVPRNWTSRRAGEQRRRARSHRPFCRNGFRGVVADHGRQCSRRDAVYPSGAAGNVAAPAGAHHQYRDRLLLARASIRLRSQQDRAGSGDRMSGRRNRSSGVALFSLAPRHGSDGYVQAVRSIRRKAGNGSLGSSESLTKASTCRRSDRRG